MVRIALAMVLCVACGKGDSKGGDGKAPADDAAPKGPIKAEISCPEGTTKDVKKHQDLSSVAMQERRRNRTVIQCLKGKKPHGPFAETYLTGAVERMGTYDNGKLEGKVTWHAGDGSLMKVRYYKNDKPSGKWRTYTENRLAEEIHFDAEGTAKLKRTFWKDGKTVRGEWEFDAEGYRTTGRNYDRTGKQISTEIYENGELKRTEKVAP